jgi:hypothetical protein
MTTCAAMFATGVLLLAGAGRAAAQTSSDSAAAAAAAAAATGVYPARPPAADSGRPVPAGVAARADSATTDTSARGVATDTLSSNGPLVVNVAPVDSTLAHACAGSGGGPMQDLLVVGFRAGTAERDKSAAAKEVTGSLVGPTAASDGEYIQLSAGSPAAATAADRLIQQTAVTRVSPAVCPPPAPGQQSQ